MVRHAKGCQRRRTQLRRADAELALDLPEGRRSSAEMFGKLDSASLGAGAQTAARHIPASRLAFVVTQLLLKGQIMSGLYSAPSIRHG